LRRPHRFRQDVPSPAFLYLVSFVAYAPFSGVAVPLSYPFVFYFYPPAVSCMAGPRR